MKKSMLRAIYHQEDNHTQEDSSQIHENEIKEVSTEEPKKSTRRKKKEEND